jgi:hypothetical protein
MQRHVARLCADNAITHYTHLRRTGEAGSDAEGREIRTPPVRSAVTYAVALHEIGHILGRHQCSRKAMVCERWAWRWARENAIAWTPQMEQLTAQALASYTPAAAEMDRERERALAEVDEALTDAWWQRRRQL